MHIVQIVFFEMNYQFTTGSERIAVLEELRKPAIIFPEGWDRKRTSQRQSKRANHVLAASTFSIFYIVITWLLQHDPDNRPTALELSQSSLMPFNLEEEYYKGALRMMSEL